MDTNRQLRYSLPFSTYDFFGYLMPGILFVISFYGWSLYSDFEWTKLDYSKYKDFGLGASLVIILLASAIVYFVGQVIGSISHILYDRILIRNIIGYPLQYILDLKSRPRLEIRVTYIAALIIFSFLVIIPGVLELLFKFWNSSFYIWISSWWPDCISNNSRVIDYEKSLSSIGIGLLILSCLGFLLIVRFRLRKIQKQRNSIISRAIDYLYIKKIDKLLINSIESIIDSIFVPLRKITSTDSKVDPEISRRFISAIENQHGVKVDTNGSDAYWISSIMLADDQAVSSKLNNWLNLYGCLKNYSCTFLLIAICISANHWFKIIYKHEVHNLTGSRILIAAIMLSLILLIRYWIIYFSYYSKYIVRSYVYKNDMKWQNNA